MKKATLIIEASFCDDSKLNEEALDSIMWRLARDLDMSSIFMPSDRLKAVEFSVHGNNSSVMAFEYRIADGPTLQHAPTTHPNAPIDGLPPETDPANF